MIHRIISVILMLTTYIMTLAQSADNSYYYWFDQNYSELVKTSVAPASISCSALKPGWHTINIFAEKGGIPSEIRSAGFIVGNGAASYHYWFDGNTSDIKIANGELSGVDCLHLPYGLHYIDIFAEIAGIATEIKRHWFVKNRVETTESEMSMLVFVDDQLYDRVKVKSAELMPIDLDVLGFEKGMHTLGILLVTPEGVVSDLGTAQFEHIGVSESGSLAFTVLTPDGTDITDQATINWYSASNELLAVGNNVSGLEYGDTLYYSVYLPENLGQKYEERIRREIIIDPSLRLFTDTLTEFRPIETFGYIRSDEAPVAGAKVSVNQYFNNKYSVKDSVVADSDGYFAIDLLKTPTHFVVSKEGYITGSMVVESLDSDAMPVSFDLIEESGKYISLKIDYQNAAIDGDQAAAHRGYDITDIAYYVSSSDGAEIVTGILSATSIPLPKGISVADVLNLKFRSQSNRFADYSTSLVVENLDSLSANIILQEEGGINCVADQFKDRDMYRALVYNDNGYFVRASTYSGGMASFAILPEGNYTIVTISGNIPVGSPAGLDDYATLGLNLGSDYILSRAAVSRGVITQVVVSGMPKADWNEFAEISSKSVFRANKTSVTADEIVTGTITLNLPDNVLQLTSAGSLTLSFPEGCIFETGSLIIDGKVMPVSHSNSAVVVNLTKEQLTSKIRFCTRAKVQGDYRIGAILSLDMGSKASYSLDEMYFHVSDYAMDVPKKTASPTIRVSGVSSPFTTVDIFDGSEKIGSSTSNGFGRWESEVTLANAKNLSRHQIWMRIVDENDYEYRSQSKECYYDKDYSVPRKVTMINTYHGAKIDQHYEQKSVFSLDGSEPQNKSYIYWPDYPEFTFLIDFTQNNPDVISAVQLVVFTENNKCMLLPAEFDEKYNCWITSYAFDHYDLPVNVDVEYIYNTRSPADMSELDSFVIDYEKNDNQLSEIDLLLNNLDKALNDPTCHQDSIDNLFGIIERKIDNVFTALDEVIPEDDDSELNYILERISNSTSYEELEKISKDWERIYISEIGNLIQPYEDLYESNSTSKSFTDARGGILFRYTTQGSTVKSSGFHNLVIEQDSNIDNGILIVRNSDNGDVFELDLSSIIDGNFSRAQKGTADNPFLEAEDVVNNTMGYAVDIAGIKEADLTALRNKEHRNAIVQKANSKKCLELWKQSYDLEAVKYYKNSNMARRQKNASLAKSAALRNSLKNLQRFTKPLGALGVGASVYIYWSQLEQDKAAWEKLISDIESLCGEPDQSELKLRALKEYDSNIQKITRRCIASLTASTMFYAAGLVSSPTVAGAFACFAAGMAISESLDRSIGRVRNEGVAFQHKLRSQIMNSQVCEDPKPDDDDDRPRPHPRKDIVPIMDPSGFVYEGVVTMPIEGVTATIYQNESTEGDGRKWNAEDYGQVNPLSTDRLGMYAWDVPRGNFKVVFEKEGYETASTDWLPVPPPQLDVNISLRKTTPAELKNAVAHKEDVVVEFDTYMDASTLTVDNIFVESDGRRIEASIELVNAVGEAPEPVLVSKVKIVPSEPITADRVTLIVKPGAETYAGVKLAGEISRVLTVEDAITDFMAPASFAVAYSESATLRVHALPAEAVAGKTLKVSSSSSMIIALSDVEVEFDSDGYAAIDIEGLLPGNAALTLTVDGYDTPVTTRISVGSSSTSEVAAPEASIPSGSVVEPGTLLNLYCQSPDAVIYYTLDGSCPCDPSSSREIYTDSRPIVIDSDITVKAMAMVGASESEIVTFSYSVDSQVTGIDGIGGDGVKIYPMPVSDLLHIEIPWSGECRLSIASSSGTVVVSDTVSGSKASIDVSPLAPGVYILTLRGDETVTRRIIKR